MLWEEGWLLKYCYAVVDGWVEKDCRIHPFTCIHPMLRFIRVHLTFTIFYASKFSSCCQDCLLWAGYNWQHLFSFLPNKIIFIFPAEEKQCCYSFMTAESMGFALELCISGKAFNNNTCNKTNPKSFVLPWHSVINRGGSLFVTKDLNCVTFTVSCVSTLLFRK